MDTGVFMLWLLLTIIAIRLQLHPSVTTATLARTSHCLTQLHTAALSFILLHTTSHSFTNHHTNAQCFTQLHTVSHSSTQLHTASHCLRQLHTVSRFSTQLRIASQSFTLPHIACRLSLSLSPSLFCLCLSVCLSVSVRLSLSVCQWVSLSLLQFKTRFVVSSPTSTRPYPWSSLEPSCITLIRPENIPDH